MLRWLMLCGLLLALTGCGDRIGTPKGAGAQTLSNRTGASVIAQKKWGGTDVTFFFTGATLDEAVQRMLDATAEAKTTEVRHAK